MKPEKKYLLATCASCGARLPAVPGKYVYSHYTGNHYCIPCCVKPPARNRRRP